MEEFLRIGAYSWTAGVILWFGGGIRFDDQGDASLCNSNCYNILLQLTLKNGKSREWNLSELLVLALDEGIETHNRLLNSISYFNKQ